MNKEYIIAEAAQGYEGSVQVSKLLIKGAKVAGADAIKFQVVYADDLAEKGYQYYDLFKSLEMSEADWLEIRSFAKKQQIDFIIDVFGSQSYNLALLLEPDGLKIHSTNFFDYPLIEKILQFQGEIYFSVGGIHPEEILSICKNYNLDQKKNIHILYGIQSEPTPLEANNLLRIPELRKYTGINSIGFMDHSNGSGPYNISLSAVAIGLGVSIFEKHITLDYQLEMEDYVSALGIRDFSNYVSSIRNLSLALGQANLKLSENEIAYRNKALKRVLAARDIKKGEIIKREDIRLNRPKIAKGYLKIEEVLGKVMKEDLLCGEPITEEII